MAAADGFDGTPEQYDAASADAPVPLPAPAPFPVEEADGPPAAALGDEGLRLSPELTEVLRAHLPEVSRRAVDAIIVGVPGYANDLSGKMGANIDNAVRLALGAFLDLASQPLSGDPATPLSPVVDAAYGLGRGEARSGRSMEALLAAYRVGARVSWRELSSAAVAGGIPAPMLARFAELVFAYIDELSAASMAGHAAQLAQLGRARQRSRELLASALLTGATQQQLLSAAESAAWDPPRTLTAVLLPRAQASGALTALDARTLSAADDIAELAADGLAVLLVPDAEGAGRRALLRALGNCDAVAGPAREWTRAAASYERARRVRQLTPPPETSDRKAPAPDRSTPVDSEDHLAELVLNADPEALHDLRSRTLAPLAALRPAAADRLHETLRAWLLHQGRREEIAAALCVHPQTVRYRMGQLRELYGDALGDPNRLLELTLTVGGRHHGPLPWHTTPPGD
ncbi:helix-turn-helix domain-containing protein [Streptomyces sp. XM4193]|uniref:PucR family transcriptional regulator n=1 Tax=Streptomyces sp. XM4193 TaxID=2929782 RepID=UPI001FF88390|nr:helix-turn-helix domain-containing protein [Streptomyces sp. XM4193]MCK1795022.1 helix-turn-helix domain-containing protein [Streptomyces sp. XM4193]